MPTLERGGTLVLDGGTGTELRRRGMPLSAAAWSALASLTHFELLRTIHADYIAAGADVITTNTFATTRFVLEAAGHGDDFAAHQRSRRRGCARSARYERPRSRDRGFDLVPAAALRRARVSRRERRERRVPRARRNARRSRRRSAVLEMMQETRHAPLACAAARAVGLPFWLGVSCRARRRRRARRVRLSARAARASARRAAAVRARTRSNVMHSPVAAIEPALREIRARWRGTARRLSRDRRRHGAAPHSVRPEASRRRRAAGSRAARRSSAAAAARRRSTSARSPAADASRPAAKSG